MKFRIAHIDTSDRLAGIFAVQRRVWGSWYDMYFDTKTSKVQSGILLGEGGTNIKLAHFNDFNDAVKYAKAYKQIGKCIIRET